MYKKLYLALLSLNMGISATIGKEVLDIANARGYTFEASMHNPHFGKVFADLSKALQERYLQFEKERSAIYNKLSKKIDALSKHTKKLQRRFIVFYDGARFYPYVTSQKAELKSFSDFEKENNTLYNYDVYYKRFTDASRKQIKKKFMAAMEACKKGQARYDNLIKRYEDVRAELDKNNISLYQTFSFIVSLDRDSGSNVSYFYMVKE